MTGRVKAIFLDRDGVISDLVYYPSHGEWEAARVASDVRILPGVAEALRELGRLGFMLLVVSNQPNVAKGKTTLEETRGVHERIVRELGDVPVREWFYCYHRAEDACECRKPRPYFLKQAEAKYGLDLSQSWMVGDQDSDVACGRAAGVRTALLECPHSTAKRGAERPDLVAPDLPALVRILARQETVHDGSAQD